MINVGKQPGFIWSNKITEGWDRNIHKWSPGSCCQAHTLESTGTLWVSMLLMSFILRDVLSPASTSENKRIPLAWCCSPLAPEPACLCHFLSFLCWLRPAPAGKWPGRSQAFFILQWGTLQIVLLDGTLAVHLLLLCTPSVNSACSLRYLNCLLWKLKVTPQANHHKYMQTSLTTANQMVVDRAQYGSARAVSP